MPTGMFMEAILKIMREGKRIYKYASVAVYEDEFKDDKVEGKGICKRGCL